MPTTRPRHTITETDAVARALDLAATRWPEDRDARGRLLLHLVEEGHQALLANEAAAGARREEAVRRTSGALTGDYEPGYLERLRAEWPA